MAGPYKTIPSVKTSFGVLLTSLIILTACQTTKAQNEKAPNASSSTVSKKERLIMDVPKGWYLGYNGKKDWFLTRMYAWSGVKEDHPDSGRDSGCSSLRYGTRTLCG